MKFYSEMLKKFYDTQSDCETAEKQAIEAKEKAEIKAKALVEQRASRAKEVENAYKNLLDARKAYNKILNDFQYKTLHKCFVLRYTNRDRREHILYHT